MRTNEKTVKKASLPVQPARPPRSDGPVAWEEQVLSLQRTAGNEAVAGLIRESSVMQRAPVAAAGPRPSPTPAARPPGTMTQPDELFLVAVKQEAHIRLDVLTHSLVA